MNGTQGLTRRQVLIGSGVTVAGVWGMSLGGVIVPQQASAQDPYAVLRGKWKDMLTGGDDVDESAPEVRAALNRIDDIAEQHLDTLDPNPGRSFLWADLDFTGADFDQSVDIRISYERLQQLAVAYATKGSTFEGDADVLALLIDALDWMNTNKYNDGDGGYGNWFNWQIGAPLALNATTATLFDELGADRVARYMAAVNRWRPTPAGTGANRVWMCMVVAGRAALVDDDAKLAAARDGISPVLPYVTSGDGFYTDGSFIQHNRHPYTGGYGLGLLANLSRLMYLLDGSPWSVTDPNRENVFAWVAEAYEPWLYRGSMMSPVRGRNASRRSQQDHSAGHDAVRAILWASQFAPPAQAEAFRGLVKHTVEQDEFRNFLDYSFDGTVPGNDVSSIVKVAAISADPDVPADGPAIRTRMFPMMDRVAHQRPEFAFAVSMSSARIFTYESINNENVRGWYTGDGMHYLYNHDLAQYDDGFWATVDHRRLPGTTVPARHGPDGSGSNYLSPHRWVGGACLGSLGAAGMQFQTYDNQLLGTFHLRLASDGQSVSAAWSPDGSRWVDVGAPAPVGSFAEPYIGMYAARGLTDAASIDARFESFQVTFERDSSAASDTFDGDELDHGRWTRIVREDPTRYRVEDGALVLMTDRGEFDRGEDSTGNIVLQPMPAGAWQVDATVRFVPQATFQHAGIVLYQDDQNFVRVQRIMGSGGDRFTFLDQRGGASPEQQVHSVPSDEFDPPDLMTTPRGRKSWFMLDDRIAFVGTGISATSGDTVETVVENRKLAAPSARFVVDGRVQLTAPGKRRSFDDVRWAHLQGSTPGADIGYVFPHGADLQILRENRAGSWADVNTNPSFTDTEQLERPYLTMWVDHRVDPANADYSWILLPGASAQDVLAFARRPDIEIVANDPDVHAVRSGGVIAANVWTTEPVTVSGLTCHGQAAVVVDHSGHQLAVAVSDPTQTNGVITLQIRRTAARLVSKDPRIHVDTLTPSITLTIDVAGARGRTAVARFELHESDT